MQELAGKAAVVTGAASGIGKAIAQRFAAFGMRLAVADIEADPLEMLAKELRAQGCEVFARQLDVADPDAFEAFATESVGLLGVPNIVCNNAGIALGGLLWQIPQESWDWIVGVNLRGVINGVASFVGRMVDANVEGHVVNTASIAGLTSSPLIGPYNITKHAVVALSECLLGDLRLVGANIGVSVLCPAWVATRIHESERNRPSSPTATGEGNVFGEAVRQFFNEAVPTGMDPAAIADEVIDAIHSNRFYVKPHVDMEPAIRARCEAVTLGLSPALLGPTEF